MSTQDPYGPHDQPREQRPGSGAAPSGGYGRPAPRNGLGVAALVLGVLAVLTGFLVVGGLLGLVAVVLGVLGSRRARRGEATNRGMAVTGVVLGVVGVLLAVVAVAAIAFVGSRAANCTDLATQGASQQQVQECVAEQFGVDDAQLGG